MTLPDFPDWTTPVQTIERVTQVTPGGTTITAGDAPVSFDTADFASLLLSITPPTGVIGNAYSLLAIWQESGGDADADSVSMHTLTAYTPALSRILWQLPVRGSSVKLYLAGTSPDTAHLTITGSNRALLGPTVTRSSENFTGTPLSDGKLIASGTAGPIPAGGSLGGFYIPPVSRAVTVQLGIATAKCEISLGGVQLAAGAVSELVLGDYVATQANPAFAEVACPGIGMNLTIVNNDTVSRTPTYRVWDVS